MSLLYLLLGILIARLFWRQLVTMMVCAAAILACYALLRAAPTVGVAPDWVRTVYGGFILGIVGGVLVAWRIVVNYLVEEDYKRDVDRARGNADKRRV